MHKKYLMIILLFTTLSAFSQKKYFKTSGEYIFAFSEVSQNSQPIDTKMRFSFFFHINEHYHFDINKTLGFYTGLGIRNFGFITQNNGSSTKRRFYGAGIPLAVKAGNLTRNTYLFFGGEYEYLFHYKIKTKTQSGKSVYKSWNSYQINKIVPSIFAGIQLKNGLNIKFTYFIDDLLNKNYTETINNIEIKPFANLKTNIYLVSLSFNLNKYNIERIKKYNPIKKEPKSIEV